ncbi:hypothetical protein [uncultured Mucilaginibacter sp.]|uniref:hypothetical protein n=1 Tax=uncultured Mucilaginibacter sp. TaxID=797541 RepID=UPI0025D659FA|nr:hypothetical protein [uncultured Mucilaginibacter sp.]
METLIINIPEKKSALVKQLLKELGVTIDSASKTKKSKTPNTLTKQTIEDARNGKGLSDPITDVASFVKSI